MHLNPDKIQINCEAVPFFGNTLSKDGLSPDLNKVRLMQEWPTPQNQKELQSFLGTVKTGIGVAMLQEDCIVQNISRCDIPNNLRPISFASKTLSSTESNYSNIEHELLGVLFAITHFKHFTYGHTVHVITDHEPLVSPFKKSLVDTSPCLT